MTIYLVDIHLKDTMAGDLVIGQTHNHKESQTLVTEKYRRIELIQPIDQRPVGCYYTYIATQHRNKQMATREQIVESLRNNDRAVARALVLLNNRQTSSEKTQGRVDVVNGQGFTAAHAARGTGMANFYLRTGFLTERQLAWWRAPTRNGSMRIELYARQLMELAAAKAARKNPQMTLEF
jgi:hypothetical protein